MIVAMVHRDDRFERILSARTDRAPDADGNGADRRTSAPVSTRSFFIASTAREREAGEGAAHTFAGLYADGGTPPADRGEGAEDSQPKSVDPTEIACELALASCAGLEALHAARRRFARENHPDGQPEALRENANLRMSIANHLVDAEIERRGTIAKEGNVRGGTGPVPSRS
ncbi:hypothetical protein [Pararhizobium mangrovi]|uniref:J domain-containing protein n=1 Tax=Pararhizobium mangrovi TaxID=2590452 RepID=A0A506U4A4_9HYPH|nr:hypothetical protein [Pararhizobium mangrovi]TPW26697.1 hypothetical protein FJU11_13925 [Pararhizobium mangrovi]